MKTNKSTAIGAALALAALVASSLAFAASATATGEVKKVDSAASKVTIKHGPIKALDMPDAMTMVYRVKDPASLKALKVGDAVRFDVDQDTSGYVVTRIEKK
jgi:Cu(I)/Ag(I) efflux system protein CusF